MFLFFLSFRIAFKNKINQLYNLLINRLSNKVILLVIIDSCLSDSIRMLLNHVNYQFFIKSNLSILILKLNSDD